MINILSHDANIVLIVDDTAANHEIIQSFLSDIGVKCESAFDGLEAVTMCNSVDSNYYSLILMDINLPCMDGLETAKKLRQIGVSSPIVAVTAVSKDEEKIKSAEAEVFDLLLFKPFNAAAFYTTISPYIKQAILRSLSPEIISGGNGSFPSLNHDICDIHTAIENMGNNPRLFMKHFNNFKNNNADLVLRLSKLIEKNQYDEAALLCHSIKGLAGMLALTSLYKHIIMLENLLREEKPHACGGHKEVSEIAQMLIAIGDDIRSICQIQF